MSATFIATTKGDGGLHFESDYNSARFREFLKKKGIRVRIQEVASGVSDQARGYYFGAVIPLIQSFVPEWKEMTGEEVHEILKKNFNYFEGYNPITKRNERYGQSIAVEDSRKFQDYLLRIADWLMENYQQNMPDPEAYKRWRDGAPEVGEAFRPLTPLAKRKQ